MIDHESDHDKHRIVILGGGFGGLYTALHLEKQMSPDTTEIVLVNRDNYFLMTPLLFEAGSGVLEPRHAVSPIRTLLRWARFVEADIETVDLEGRVVYAAHPHSGLTYELPYDDLVVALGGITNRKLIPGSEDALAFKTLADAVALRNHTIDLFERADAEDDPVRRRELLTFVVVGAGLVGIELMGELTDFVPHLCASYPRVSCDDLSFHVVEAGPKVLAEMDRDLADYAQRTLEKRGVQFHLSTPVSAIGLDHIRLGDATLRAETIVLAAGVAVNPLVAALPHSKDARGKIRVEATLRSIDRPEVWALGDCASIPGPDGKPYPPLAQHALREAKVLAANLAASREGQPLANFEYTSKGTLASLGAYSGVGKLAVLPDRWLKVRGFAGWWVWRTYYLLQMPRLERRLRILLDWTVALFFKNDVVKLDLMLPRHVELERRRLGERAESWTDE